ncbi:AAA family ATPase [Bacillus sp. RAR_GA_16]|uniref:AAA family ATPase n=1 Tax=Bacillus sp. RAR_GA_16 TaxID=2876774 RepID=UPI001CCEB632|nr:AAA family ATPase [Bacillus sp. RAR_GA_16]MCA0174126.1 AAA family ATPase [Bacillus sp. RAR_GA_16]
MKLTEETQYVRSIRLHKQEENEFPFSLPAVQSLQKKLIFHPNVTYIVGENGMGKSTLLEGIAVALGMNPEGGTKNFNFSSYASHSNLHQFLKVTRGVHKPDDLFFFRAETYYNLATTIEQLDREGFGPRIIDSYGGKSLHEQSHGESFFATFMYRFGGEGLYILDEPEAALSPIRQLSMLTRIHELVQEGSQFIISTHSPILMSYPESKILQLSDNGMRLVNLEETDHYVTMKQFFDDKDRLMHHLLKDER